MAGRGGHILLPAVGQLHRAAAHRLGQQVGQALQLDARLAAEAASQGRRDHRDLSGGDVEERSHQGADHKGGLGGGVKGHLPRGGDFRNGGPGLHGGVVSRREGEFGGDGPVTALKNALGIAFPDTGAVGHIGAGLRQDGRNVTVGGHVGVDQGGSLRQGLLRRQHRRQGLVADPDQGGGGPGCGRVFRHHGGHRLAVMAHLAPGQGRLVSQIQTQVHRQIVTGDHGQDPRHGRCGVGVHRQDLGMGMGAGQQAGMEQAGHIKVVQVPDAAGHFVGAFLPGDGGTEGALTGHGVPPLAVGMALEGQLDRIVDYSHLQYG